MASIRVDRSVQRLQLNLQKVRQSKSVTLEQISRITKISPRFLIAIEQEEFDKLPGGVFDISYLRQYAAAIGYEAGKLLDCYHARMGTEEPVPVNAKPTRWSFSW